MISPIILIVIAAIMSGVIIVLIRAYLGVQNSLQAKLILFGVGMMVAMFVGAGFYEVYPSGLSLAYVVGANMLVMVVGLVYVLSGLDSLEVKKMNRRAYTQYFTALVLLNEASMGFVFVGAQVGTNWLFKTSPATLPANIVTTSINTYWFFLPLFFEMASATYFSRPHSKSVHYALLGASLFSPSSFKHQYWSLTTTLLIVGLAVYITARHIKNMEHIEGTYYLLALAVAAAVSYASGYWLLYALMSLLAINWFFTSLLARNRERGG
ncbi:MAG: hypothetical protein QW514_07540 [Thermoprotei archaeon]